MENENKTLDTADVHEKISIKQLALKWGVILGIVSIAVFLGTVFAGLIGNTAMSFLGYIPTIIIIVLAHREFKNEGDGFMSYGQGLGSGTLIALVGGIVSTVFFYVYVKFVDNSFIATLKEQQIQQLEEKGMSSEQIDQALSISGKFMTPEIMAVFGIVGAVIAGFILSLIISAFTKNSNPELDI